MLASKGNTSESRMASISPAQATWQLQRQRPVTSSEISTYDITLSKKGAPGRIQTMSLSKKLGGNNYTKKRSAAYYTNYSYTKKRSAANNNSNRICSYTKKRSAAYNNSNRICSYTKKRSAAKTTLSDANTTL